MRFNVLKSVRGFWKDQKGTLSVEAAIVMPLLFWAITASFTFIQAPHNRQAQPRAFVARERHILINIVQPAQIARPNLHGFAAQNITDRVIGTKSGCLGLIAMEKGEGRGDRPEQQRHNNRGINRQRALLIIQEPAN